LVDNGLFAAQSFCDSTARTQIRAGLTERHFFTCAANRYIGGRKIFRPYKGSIDTGKNHFTDVFLMKKLKAFFYSLR